MAFSSSSKKDDTKGAPLLEGGGVPPDLEKIARDAMASGSSDAMLSAAKQLRDAGATDTAAKLETAASKIAAAAAAAKQPTKPAEKVAPDATSAAVTAKQAADVVNQAASAIAAPSTEAVKDTAKAAVALATSAPPAVAKEARAVMEAAKQAIQTSDPATVATLARASAELARAAATPATAKAATAAVNATKLLEASPTAANASKVSAVVSTAAVSAIKASGAPIAQPGRSTYVVQKGDSPWAITQRLTGNGARYKELLAANPQKPTKLVNDGVGNMVPTFAQLSANEVLKLPASWVSAAPATTVQPPANEGTFVPGVATPAWLEDLYRMEKENPALYDATMKTKGSKDPAVLTRAADIVRAKYPNLAIVFLVWAKQASPGGAPVVALPVATTPPTSAPSTYVVQSGDSAWRIAQKLAGSGLRWKELVAANPQKKRASDGNFASLYAREVLKVPASWTAMTPMTVGAWPRPARTLNGMGMAPVAA
jgi:LysM repeat protein